MTQIEFDNEMVRLNGEMRKEYIEADALMEENFRQRSEIKKQLLSLQHTLHAFKMQAIEIENRRKDIARKYHDKRYQLRVELSNTTAE